MATAAMAMEDIMERKELTVLCQKVPNQSKAVMEEAIMEAGVISTTEASIPKMVIPKIGGIA